MRRRKINQLGMPSLYTVGLGVVLVIFLGVYFYGYDGFWKRSVAYEYVDLIEHNEVVCGEHIYNFMNECLFAEESIEDNLRLFTKLKCFSLKHSSALERFFVEAAPSVLTIEEKSYMKKQLGVTLKLWDQSLLPSAWCLTPKELYKIQKNDTLDYWTAFREFCGNGGLHEFSIPVFSEDKKTVVIEHSGQGGLLLGSGEILVFKNRNGVWRLVLTYPLWIS